MNKKGLMVTTLIELVIGLVVVASLVGAAYELAYNEQFIRQYIGKDVALMLDTISGVPGDVDVVLPIEGEYDICIGDCKTKHPEFTNSEEGFVIVDNEINTKFAYGIDKNFDVSGIFLEEPEAIHFLKKDNKLTIEKGVIPGIISEVVGEVTINTPITQFTVSSDPQKGKEQLKKVLSGHQTNKQTKVNEDEFINLIYDLGFENKIDPGFALGVSAIESAMGKDAIAGEGCRNLFGVKKKKGEDGCAAFPNFKEYSSVKESIEDFYGMIYKGYLKRDQNTPAKMAAPLAYAKSPICSATPDSGKYFCCKTEYCYCCHKDEKEEPWVKTVTSVRQKLAKLK